jgi:ankyrin repeat protein
MGINQSNQSVYAKKILVLELVQYSDYLSFNDLCQLYDTCKNIPLSIVYFKNKNYIYDFYQIKENPNIRLFKSILEIYPSYNFDSKILFSAVENNYSRYINLLIKYLVDFDFNITSSKIIGSCKGVFIYFNGPTFLWIACRYGKTKSLKALLNYHKIDINKSWINDITPLHIACSMGNTDCVKMLLSVPGLDVNKADEEGNTPLFSATWCGNIDCVKLLLTHPEIDIYKENNNGITPLKAAIRNNQIKIIGSISSFVTFR